MKETEDVGSSSQILADLEAVRRVSVSIQELVAEDVPVPSFIRYFFDSSIMQRSRLVASYTHLIQFLHRPENLRFIPAMEAGLQALKDKKLEMAQFIFDDIRDHVIKPSPLFYLLRVSVVR